MSTSQMLNDRRRDRAFCMLALLWLTGSCSPSSAPEPREDVADITSADVQLYEFPPFDPCSVALPAFPTTLTSESLTVKLLPNKTIEISGTRTSTPVDLAVETTNGVTLVLHDKALNSDPPCNEDHRLRYVAYLSLDTTPVSLELKILGPARGTRGIPFVEQANEFGDLVFAGREGESSWLDIIREGGYENRKALPRSFVALSAATWQESNERGIVWIPGYYDYYSMSRKTALLDIGSDEVLGVYSSGTLYLREPCTPDLLCLLDKARTPSSMVHGYFPWVTYDGHVGLWVRRTKIGIVNGALSAGPKHTSRFHHLEGAGKHQLIAARAGGSLGYTQIDGLAYAVSASRNGDSGPLAVIVRKAENQVVLLGDNGHLLPSTAGVIAKVVGEPHAVSPKWPGVVVNVVDDGTDHQRVILWWPGRWPHSPGADRGACDDTMVCDDNDVCTADWCDDAIGCRHTPTGPTPCRVADSLQCANHLNYPSLHKGWGNCPK